MVPVREPFEVLIRPGNLNAIDAILFDAFRGAPEFMLRQIASMLRTLPSDTLSAVHDYLIQFPDVATRNSELHEIVAANGQVPGTTTSTPMNPIALPYAHTLTTASNRSYWVPAPPTPQTVCLTNGFDPRWGQPPGTYRDVALRFDSSIGAYAFDRAYALSASPTDADGRPLYNKFTFDDIQSRYQASMVLVPFRANQGSPWRTRWEIPVVPPKVVCETL